jgi:hypothetical protein
MGDPGGDRCSCTDKRQAKRFPQVHQARETRHLTNAKQHKSERPITSDAHRKWRELGRPHAMCCLKYMLPIVSMVAGKRLLTAHMNSRISKLTSLFSAPHVCLTYHSVRQMPYVPQHSATNAPRRANRNVRQRAVEGTVSKPGLGWKLEGATLINEIIVM